MENQPIARLHAISVSFHSFGAAMVMTPWLVLFLALMSVTCLPMSQKESLVALYNSTGGPFWTNNTNWITSTDPCAPLWFGVTCDASKANVISLSLPSNNMTGSLPDLQLPALDSLYEAALSLPLLPKDPHLLLIDTSKATSSRELFQNGQA